MKFTPLASMMALTAFATAGVAAEIKSSSLKSFVASNHDILLKELKTNTDAMPTIKENPMIMAMTKDVEHEHGHEEEMSSPFTVRRLAGADESFCDIQFMECLDHPKCVSCFKDMQAEDIDWSIIPPHSTCTDVLTALTTKLGKCHDLVADTPETNTFCDTFDSCIIWKDDIDNNSTDKGDDTVHIDCDSLTECQFDGMKPSYIGDGICHEFINGCYNTAICNYDGGDCCPDTCKNSTDLVSCGSDQYFCRDPKSKNCETCEEDPSTPVQPSEANCKDNESPYKLFLYDSFGDGWDLTEMMITDRDDSEHNPIYDGRLEDGSEGMEYICLSKEAACYQVRLFGGFWGNEVSWQIKPMRNGAPELASGGAPMDCEFAVGGAKHCTNTCDGRPNVDPAQDEKYHTYHKMANCIEDKCVIQLSMCEKDLVCASCLGDTEAYCMANDIFNALTFCTECNCVEGVDEEDKEQFCKDKSRGKHENEDATAGDDFLPSDSSSNNLRDCSYDEFLTGSDAVIKYSECSGIERISALLTNFDPDNFGMLDSFESCASAYADDRHNKKALDCMRILNDATINPTKGLDPSKAKSAPAKAIAALATDLLQNGEGFCQCSANASDGLQACKDFIHFKTLLYESIDACKALDAIDCAAWGEFYQPCKVNMEQMYKKIDFRKKKQCQYIHDGCGNVGPFPSFRRLDCDAEVGEEAWNMYLDYESNCLRGGGPSAPVPSPKPSGPDPNGGGGSSGNKVYPTGDDDASSYIFPSSSNKKKYTPPESRNGSKGRKFFHFLLFCAALAGAHWLYKFYKNRYGSFDYNRFRRARNYGPDSEGMYDSLTMENAQVSFQPPTLPPPPAVYDNGGNNSGPYNGFA